MLLHSPVSRLQLLMCVKFQMTCFEARTFECMLGIEVHSPEAKGEKENRFSPSTCWLNVPDQGYHDQSITWNSVLVCCIPLAS